MGAPYRSYPYGGNGQKIDQEKYDRAKRESIERKLNTLKIMELWNIQPKNDKEAMILSRKKAFLEKMIEVFGIEIQAIELLATTLKIKPNEVKEWKKHDKYFVECLDVIKVMKLGDIKKRFYVDACKGNNYAQKTCLEAEDSDYAKKPSLAIGEYNQQINFDAMSDKQQIDALKRLVKFMPKEIIGKPPTLKLIKEKKND